MKVKSTLGSIVAVGTLIAAIATATPAQASAFGVEPIYWETVSVSAGPVSTSIPTGFLTHRITGDGLYVEEQVANFSPATGIGFFKSQRCDWRIAFRAYDAAGKAILGRTSPVAKGKCDRTGAWRIKNKSWPNGTTSICALLFAQGVEIARQCHRT